MERRYPASLFVLGFFSNIVFHFFYLFIPAVILLVTGIFVKTALRIGLAILAVDIVLSFVEQMRIRAAFMMDSENADFRRFQDALSQDGNWRDNVIGVVEDIMKEKKD